MAGDERTLFENTLKSDIFSSPLRRSDYRRCAHWPSPAHAMKRDVCGIGKSADIKQQKFLRLPLKPASSVRSSFELPGLISKKSV